MERRCKNALCNTTDPSQFIKSSKYLCRNCLKQRRDMAKQTLTVGDVVSKQTDAEETVPSKQTESVGGGNALSKTFGPGPKGSKTRKTKKGTDNDIAFSLTKYQANIIATQQKMIEHQQRQTDALFNLTEKLLTRSSLFPEPTISKPEVVESPSVSSTLSHEFRSKLISHTPRRRQEFVHYKNRLD